MIHNGNPEIWVPPLPTDIDPEGTHLFMAFGALINPDGSVAWQDEKWGVNTLHDAGEQKMLQVFLSESANVSKYLALLNQTLASVVASTDTFTLTSHGFGDGDQVVLGPVVTGTATANLTSGNVYYVRDSATNTFKVASTSGGAALDVFSADGTVAVISEEAGTMAAVTETKTPASGGYDRQLISAGQWTDDGLISGDYRFTAAAKTFGPMATAAGDATHAALTTTLTSTAGVLLASQPLSAKTSIAVGQSFTVTFRWTMS